jgi:alpha-tubulin suppressor-like RCC1 family protein
VPTEVKALANEKIVACAAGAHHSLAVTGRGTVYSFGLGHTGIKNTIEQYYFFQIVICN